MFNKRIFTESCEGKSLYINNTVFLILKLNLNADRSFEIVFNLIFLDNNKK